MKIDFITIQIAFTALLLITHTHVWNMENNYQISKYSNVLTSSLPREILSSIAKESLSNTIKLALSLKKTNKNYNTNEFFIQVGKACQCYSLTEKNAAMKNLLKSMNDPNYYKKQPTALLLTYAGAKNDAYKHYSLLLEAVHLNDREMITALFENNTSPNQCRKDWQNNPVFFDITTIPILQIFINKGVTLNTQGSQMIPNVLFACLIYNYSLEMIKFYLNHNVDARIKEGDGENLLHYLARKDPYQYNINDYIQIGALLIKTAPELLNELNKNQETPLDRAKQTLKEDYLGTKERTIKLALIKLFEEYGGKTAEQLKQNVTKQIEPKKELEEAPACCVCFENVEKIINIPCNNIHSDKICNDCYDTYSKKSNNCPLCRGALS